MSDFSFKGSGGLVAGSDSKKKIAKRVAYACICHFLFVSLQPILKKSPQMGRIKRKDNKK